MKTKSSFVHYLMLVGAMLIFGTIGVFRRYIPDVPSATLASMRGIIGVIVLLIASIGRKINIKLLKKHFLKLFLSGAFIGINWIFLFESFNHTTVAIGSLCCYTAPIMIIAVSPFVLKEKLTVKKIICVALAVLGMVLVSDVIGGDIGSNAALGITFGLCSAVVYAAVTVLNQKMKEIPSLDKTLVQLASAALVVTPYALITEKVDYSALTANEIMLILILGIVHTGGAYILYFGCMERISGQTVAILEYIDPVASVLLSVFLLGESMNGVQIIGAVLMLSAIIASEISFSLKSKKAISQSK